MLADDLLDDARHLAAKGATEQRMSCLRRSISTAYYAVFHLLIADFVEHWEYEDQRGRLARMFSHRNMRRPWRVKDKSKSTPVESKLIDVVNAFSQLQEDRLRADYDLDWNLTATDVEKSIFLADQIFQNWPVICQEDVARHHLLTMFGAGVEQAP